MLADKNNTRSLQAPFNNPRLLFTGNLIQTYLVLIYTETKNVTFKFPRNSCPIYQKGAGVDSMIAMCPFYHVMYDVNQRAIESKLQKKFEIPVPHHPQLLGLAMSSGARDRLGAEQVRVNPAIFDSQG